VNVSPGDRVLAGQVLARLDSVEESAVADGAAAQVASALSLDLRARRELGKLVDLVPEEIAADELLDGAAGDAELELIHASAQVHKQAAALKLAKNNLAKRTIRSPMAGVVLARSVEPGESIPASPPGPPLFVIGSDPKELRMNVEVDESYINSVGPDTVRFTTPAHGGDELSASILQVLPLADTVRSPARYTVVLSVPNIDGSLHAGMTAMVDIPVKTQRDALAVPESAIGFDSPSGFVQFVSGAQSAAKVPFVWFTAADGQPVKRTVEIGALDADLVEIRGFGLQSGLVVVTDRSPATCRVRPPVSPFGAGEP
jgi:HlyD family secretion protein